MNEEGLKHQEREQVILALEKITDLTSDSKTALRMLQNLYDVKGRKAAP